VNKQGSDWVYQFAPKHEGYPGYQSYNLVELLNNSEEFRDRLRTSSQYLVTNVMITLSLDRIPEAGDRLSKLLLSINTSKVGVDNPLVQSNVMILPMNTIGTKNFNFHIQRGSVLPENGRGWLESSYLFIPAIYLKLSAQDSNYLAEDQETTVVLGTFKITFTVKTRVQDYMKAREPTKFVTVEEKLENLESKMTRLEHGEPPLQRFNKNDQREPLLERLNSKVEVIKPSQLEEIQEEEKTEDSKHENLPEGFEYYFEEMELVPQHEIKLDIQPKQKEELSVQTADRFQSLGRQTKKENEMTQCSIYEYNFIK
jgi:hypothetical protein